MAETPVLFSYDLDGFLTQAGSLSLARDAQHRLLTGITLDTVTTIQVDNPFGELATTTVTINGTLQYAVTCSGRIPANLSAGRLAHDKPGHEIRRGAIETDARRETT